MIPAWRGGGGKVSSRLSSTIRKTWANLGYTVSTIPLEGLTICKCGVIIK